MRAILVIIGVLLATSVAQALTTPSHSPDRRLALKISGTITDWYGTQKVTTKIGDAKKADNADNGSNGDSNEPSGNNAAGSDNAGDNNDSGENTGGGNSDGGGAGTTSDNQDPTLDNTDQMDGSDLANDNTGNDNLAGDNSGQRNDNSVERGGRGSGGGRGRRLIL